MKSSKVVTFLSLGALVLSPVFASRPRPKRQRKRASLARPPRRLLAARAWYGAWLGTAIRSMVSLTTRTSLDSAMSRERSMGPDSLRLSLPR